MDDILIEGLVRLLFGGWLSGDLDTQHSWRVYTSVTLVVLLLASLWWPATPSSKFSAPLAVVGAALASWNLAFSLVDMAKELPEVPWRGVVAIMTSTALLVVAGRFLAALIWSAA
jgi:hypothetical protein